MNVSVAAAIILKLKDNEGFDFRNKKKDNSKTRI
jgi:hypothetical protein